MFSDFDVPIQDMIQVWTTSIVLQRTALVSTVKRINNPWVILQLPNVFDSRSPIVKPKAIIVMSVPIEKARGRAPGLVICILALLGLSIQSNKHSISCTLLWKIRIAISERVKPISFIVVERETISVDKTLRNPKNTRFKLELFARSNLFA
ncbi:hypothetical protein N7471_003302 [Penicillium samsonianum]|uniref:uncharacterized protein n=1 Tax=Penicillium samsonianum TaxID=1882272 RepID=UPI002549BA54|nr:uncharacterized protein N7471_003302 [Penicillium samsonianum]KAJ6143849.1 hypothetical protein N7471_003302 [Penicillium samsonianum]